MNEKTTAMAEVQARMGWTDDTLFLFALRFIAERGLNEDFEDDLREKAAEEEAGVVSASADDDPQPED